jgi:hypothetical protein
MPALDAATAMAGGAEVVKTGERRGGGEDGDVPF